VNRRSPKPRIPNPRILCGDGADAIEQEHRAALRSRTREIDAGAEGVFADFVAVEHGLGDAEGLEASNGGRRARSASLADAEK
jgi:hypothetical protein